MVFKREAGRVYIDVSHTKGKLPLQTRTQLFRGKGKRTFSRDMLENRYKKKGGGLDHQS